MANRDALTAESLLAGPRGRRMLLAYALQVDESLTLDQEPSSFTAAAH